MTKGQLIGQVFIYIITLLIVAFVLYYGYNAIITFNDKAEQVVFIQFKNNFQNTVEILSYDFGSVKIKEFTLPENINEVCFIKNYQTWPTLQGTGYPLMEDRVTNSKDRNVFLIEDQMKESFMAGELSLDSGDYLCVPAVSNKIRLKMEGKGDHTIISKSIP